MQEEGSLSSKYSAVQLAPPPIREDVNIDDKVGDSVDTPAPSSSGVMAVKTPGSDNKKEGMTAAMAGDEVIPNTSSTITVDSSIVEEMLGVRYKCLPFFKYFHVYSGTC